MSLPPPPGRPILSPGHHPLPPSLSRGPTPLEQLLIERIRAAGPITLADYMTEALGHPSYGYYMTRSPFGSLGDFVTAPEISQIFGELIGAWLIEAWREIGRPARVNLIELGPGRGTLMSDILRTARLAPDFLRAAHLYMVESSPYLRAEQQKKLAQSNHPLSWVNKFDEVPPAPSLILANEFLDCLPIRQFICVQKDNTKTWYERLVGINPASGGQALCLTRASNPGGPTPPGGHSNWPGGAQPHDVFEFNIKMPEIMKQIAGQLLRDQGRALIIDYGYLDTAPGDTLQAVRAHQFCDPLSAPGSADLTAHVNFGALGHLARAEGLVVHGPVAQGTFLNRLGAQLRLDTLCQTVQQDQADALRAGVERLTHPDEMGALFKVVCVASPPDRESPDAIPRPPAGFTV